MLPNVYALLRASSDVVALVGSRIYRHGEAPQGVQSPYITWFVLSGAPGNLLDSKARYDAFEVQVDCWSTADAGVEAMARAVRDAIEKKFQITTWGPNGRDPDAKEYRIGMAYTHFEHRPIPETPDIEPDAEYITPDTPIGFVLPE